MSQREALTVRPAIGRAIAVVGLAGAAVVAVFALLWWKLPRWCPRFVIEHSPWVDPIVRSPADSASLLDKRDRLDEILGDHLAARLAPYLGSNDEDIRDDVAWTLGGSSQRPGAFDALITAADRGCREARKQLRYMANDTSFDGAPTATDEQRARARETVRRHDRVDSE